MPLQCMPGACWAGEAIGAPLTPRAAAQAISQEIRSATTSMTSVPKPLKFLRKHYAATKEFYQAMPASENKARLADVLSVLAISSASQESRESLHFRLAGSKARHACSKLAVELGQRLSPCPSWQAAPGVAPAAHCSCCRSRASGSRFCPPLWHLADSNDSACVCSSHP